jgi:phosphatidylserine/phosphatidylglycerophosphate/cardiolipin synthase-like enzyme
VSRLLRDFERATRVRIVASHIKGPAALRYLLGLAGTGAALEVLADATPRRVPERVEARLSAAGIPIRRVGGEKGLPMHDKFVLIEGPSQRAVVFGSFNWTERSLRMNHEISAASRAPELFDAFAARWDLLASAAGAV